MYLLFDYKALFMYTVGPFLALSLCSPFPRAGPLTDLSGIYDLEPILWHLAQPLCSYHSSFPMAEGPGL